jgi:hypothetical protein
MDLGLTTKTQMKVSQMIKKLSLILLVLCPLSMLSQSAWAHDDHRPSRRSPEERSEERSERPSQGQHRHYYFNNPCYNSRCRPRSMRPYGFYNYGYYGPRRRGSEFYLRFGSPHRRRGGFGIGFGSYGW